MALNYRDFIHPEDAVALEKLQSLAGFDKVMSWMMELGVEEYCQMLYMSNHIRLSSKQLPKIYNLLPPICEKFGIDVPDFYLQQHPQPGAVTTGDKRCFIVITSGLIESVEDSRELQSILAHECGHILCRHVFYSTMAEILAGFGYELNRWIPIPTVILEKLEMPLQLAMSYWSRKSELSADRASAVFTGDANVSAKALLRLTAGSSKITREVNIDEFAKQVADCDNLKLNSKWRKLLSGYSVMNESHPFADARFKELMSWGKSEKFVKLCEALKSGALGRTCSNCGAALEAKQRFCRFCGSKIQTSRKG